jgi:hypothetical protein
MFANRVRLTSTTSAVLALLCGFATSVHGQEWNLPPRQTNALVGSVFAKAIAHLTLAAREERIFAEVKSGNVPEFMRRFCHVTVRDDRSGSTNVAVIFAAPDYFCVGSDADYFLAPVSPATAQRIADEYGFILPTRKLVNDLWHAAAVKLDPVPLQPSPNMVTVPVFQAHNTAVRTQRTARLADFPAGALVAGHKKDVVISARLAALTNRVAIFGWHKPDGQPIQPLYCGHGAAWVDYSHGIRFVSGEALLNGHPKKILNALADPELSGLFSDEGLITNGCYGSFCALGSKSPELSGFRSTGVFGERELEFTVQPNARIMVNIPAESEYRPGRRTRLVLYALPNGNTIEQTKGKRTVAGDDWHFDIQHIAAQTRWLRARLTNETVVIAYLEAGTRSWPAWRQMHGDRYIPQIIGAVRDIFSKDTVDVVLTGHSGGGSFTFGYLNTVEIIPDEVVRIAFLDSNYGYRTTNHSMKLTEWLLRSDRNHLSVLAYQDYLGLLDGRSFVSESGGTWGRSQLMLRDFSRSMEFGTRDLGGGLKEFSALHARTCLLLKENPEQKIFHTLQVERNGFIHTQLLGTALCNSAYEYFGARAYADWIR